ncbi:M60 family metallopeptidase [Niabella drilacis]|uniref:Peptidase M60, enhancin and enhancin-like n=1 Tax=Niabella drilacis (strain DSM 25811 / CCM 8410 / CCUG 62505 / LMG 26954 / E90) TaxID=1285928 RepID=A0A1G7BF35_NIADE|nr:M60 family metallopeptidase [Niabella drilacis]SDE25340.1 Peptidase M60, enhancin and enhancin-like [Niabella drilacis]
MRLSVFMKPWLVASLLIFMVLGCQKAAPVKAEERPVPGGEPGNPKNTDTPVKVAKNAIGSEIQEFNEKTDAFKESVDRLRQGNPWSDFEPTGFYLPPNTVLTLKVEQLAGSALPKLLIGTYSFDTLRWDPLSVKLTAGTNTIAADPLGGLLWVRYTTTGTPAAKVRITFQTGAVRAPVFIKDETVDWQAQLNTYTGAPAALLLNKNVYLVVKRSRALSTGSDAANFILQTIDKGVDKGENYISGLDGSAPEHQLPTHKILMTESNKRGLWGAASYYRTWFAPGLMDEALTAQKIIASGWGAWHELGHMRQQQAWKWSVLGEVTVNIYTMAAERAINGGGATRLKGAPTTNAMNFLALTDPNKDFNSNTQMADGNFTRLFMFHQLWLAFGDNFYIRLHQQTRSERPDLSADADKMRYFMLKACTISGRNLSRFFRKWGFRVSESVYTEIAGLGLPEPETDPSTLKDS